MREAGNTNVTLINPIIRIGTGINRTLLSVVLVLILVSPTSWGGTITLPENLENIISEKISSTSTEEKKMVTNWPPGKKLAEFFCQERALKEPGESYAGADRVFLSTSDDEPPRFVARNRIQGKGSVRHDAGWTDITYICEVDLQTGEPTEFVFEEAN